MNSKYQSKIRSRMNVTAKKVKVGNNEPVFGRNMREKYMEDSNLTFWKKVDDEINELREIMINHVEGEQ